MLANRPLIGRNQRVVTRVVDHTVVAAVATSVVVVMSVVGCQGARSVAMVGGGAGNSVLIERVSKGDGRAVLDQVAAHATVSMNAARRRHGYHVAWASLNQPPGRSHLLVSRYLGSRVRRKRVAAER